MKFFRKHKVMALILTAVIVFCFVSDTPYFCDTKNVSADTKKTSKDDLEDGVYTIQGKLRHATLNQPSMGDTALTQPMKIIKNGNELSLRLEFKSLTSGVFKGYLYGFNYFPSWTDSENIPKGTKAESVKVTEYYEGVYDEYNDSKNGTDLNVKGKLYPHYAIMPIKQNEKVTWVQVYVPVMEAISKGSGTQYARLILDWSTLAKTDEKPEDIIGGGTTIPNVTAKPQATKKPSVTSGPAKTKKPSSSKTKKLNINNLSDGKYTLEGQMLKIDKKSSSMSNEAVNHNISLKVKNGKYILTLDFSGLKVGNSKGYLSRLKYFKSGYKTVKGGVPQGKTASVKVLSYQKNNGKKLSDIYGTNYPKKISFPMIKEAKKNGYVPLQVFVPIMDAISQGSGTQPVYLKLNLKSIVSGNKKIKTSSGSSSKKRGRSAEASKNSSAAESTDKAVSDNDKNSAQTDENSSLKDFSSKSLETSNKQAGKIYSCNIVSSYKHPVTGKVEDAGGETSYATGQGMVESVMGTNGMLEVTDSGSDYLTMRLGLIDYTSSHKFYVQKRGASNWSEVSSVITKKGVGDSNTKNNSTGIKAGSGATADYCIQIPDKDCIVKVSMYVEPMGRNVIFFAYAKDFKEGKPSGMTATKAVTGKASSKTASSEIDNSDDSGDSDESGLTGAQGLSLSTAGEASSKENLSDDGNNTKNSNLKASGENMTMLKWFIVISLSMTLSGLILIAAGAGVVYYFKRNWRRWGEEMEDDED